MDRMKTISKEDLCSDDCVFLIVAQTEDEKQSSVPNIFARNFSSSPMMLFGKVDREALIIKFIKSIIIKIDWFKPHSNNVEIIHYENIIFSFNIIFITFFPVILYRIVLYPNEFVYCSVNPSCTIFDM